MKLGKPFVSFVTLAKGSLYPEIQSYPTVIGNMVGHSHSKEFISKRETFIEFYNYFLIFPVEMFYFVVERLQKTE